MDAEKKAVLIGVAEQNPELTDYGFGTFDEANGGFRNPQKFEEDRQKLLSPDERTVEQFRAACEWLSGHNKTKTVQKRGTSYGMKHRAAREIGYVTNGVFIAAMYASGFTVKKVGPNARINISYAKFGK